MNTDTPPPPMKTTEQFCTEYNACSEGREWALANCKDMQEVWQTARPDWLIWVATRKGVLTEKELRLFAVFCARSVEHLLTDDRSRNAIDVAERFANGEATSEELAAAGAAAGAAAWDAAGAAAWDAAGFAACDAASAAAWAAAWAAARDARDAWAAAGANQAQYLRKNTKPNFDV